jgi:hypothetical protein
MEGESMAENRDSENPFVALGNALSLVFRAIGTARKGLEKNPTKEDERELNETLVDLERKRTEIRAKLNALIAGERQVVTPTAAQVKEISNLTAQVEALTNASITASAAVALTAKILSLATDIAAA